MTILKGSIILFFLISYRTWAKSADTSLLDLYQASYFFQAAMDHPELLSKKFCNIPTEQISMYSMQTKARLDQSWKEFKIETKSLWLKMPTYQKCEAQCYCDFYQDLKERIKKKQFSLDLQTLQRFTDAEIKVKRQNALNCGLQLKSFCRSPLFKTIQKDVQDNTP